MYRGSMLLTLRGRNGAGRRGRGMQPSSRELNNDSSFRVGRLQLKQMAKPLLTIQLSMWLRIHR